MIGKLNHVAIAVKDIEAATRLYRENLGATASAAMAQPEHGVTTVFITLPNTKIELLEPLGAASPIAKFLERNPEGGIHHLCYEVEDIVAARDRLKAAGATASPRWAPMASPCCSCTPRTFSARWSSLKRREWRGGEWRCDGWRLEACPGPQSQPFISSYGGWCCSRCCPGA
jgi:methylmalonyl-CoA/ethylmalonyl-CoA epimerase